MKRVLDSVHVRQFIKFGIVGLGNTVIDFGMYVVGTRFLSLYYLYANTLSWVCAVFFSFTMNKFWTFRAVQPGALVRQYSKFFIVSFVSLVISLALLHVLVDMLHVHDIIAKGATIAVVMFWNFFMNKFWTFSS
jgi:putative flippase GtrA